MHRRAAVLFERLAAAYPDRVLVIDRREHDTAAITEKMTKLLGTPHPGPAPQASDGQQ